MVGLMLVDVCSECCDLPLCFSNLCTSLVKCILGIRLQLAQICLKPRSVRVQSFVVEKIENSLVQ